MESSSKFMFETSFEGPEVGPPEAAKAPRAQTFTEEEMAAVREGARAEGLAAGLEQARKEFKASTDAALGEIARHLTSAQQSADKLRSEALSLALTVARKLAPALMARQPMAEIEAFFGECLADAIDEPRVVVRVNEALLANMVERVDELAAASGFDGKIVVIAEESLAGSDCRIEWADGGADRSREQLESKIDDAVARYLDPGAGARPEIPVERDATVETEDEPVLETAPEAESEAAATEEGWAVESTEPAISPATEDASEDAAASLGVGEDIETASATAAVEAALQGGPVESTTPS